VINKIDITGDEPRRSGAGGEQRVWVSAKSGAGIDLLRRALLETVGWSAQSEGVYLARERHLVALRDAAARLEAAAARQQEPDLMAEELRLAHAALGRIVGDFSADDLLGEIFSRFCIGK
jgi:tRNA modification GTPase